LPELREPSGRDDVRAELGSTQLPRRDVGFERRLMRQAGPFMSENATVVALRVELTSESTCDIVLDSRYFGITDDTITKLCRQFPMQALPD
jgi:hypothetical protein